MLTDWGGRMKRLLPALLLCALALPALAQDKVTTTGWFADEGCVRGRVARGEFKANNPDCAEKCIKEGAKAVFIAPNEKKMYYVSSATALDHLAEHVQVTGTLDAKTNMLAIDSVKDLGDYVGPACARPRKKSGK